MRKKSGSYLCFWPSQRPSSQEVEAAVVLLRLLRGRLGSFAVVDKLPRRSGEVGPNSAHTCGSGQGLTDVHWLETRALLAPRSHSVPYTTAR